MTAPLDEARLRELAEELRVPWSERGWVAAKKISGLLAEAREAATGIDALLDALSAEQERADRTYMAAADYCEFYAEERMTLCGDTILHDPLLKGGDFTMQNMVKSQELNIDGTINSAAYHAAMNLAAHFRSLATQKAED